MARTAYLAAQLEHIVALNTVINVTAHALHAQGVLQIPARTAPLAISCKAHFVVLVLRDSMAIPLLSSVICVVPLARNVLVL